MLERLPLLFVAVALSAHATVYKCANDKGGVVYQDTACAPGRELANLDIDPPPPGVAPGAPRPAKNGARAPAATPAAAQPAARSASAAERKFLQAGMSEADVVRSVGPPDVESGARAKQGRRRWQYLPTTGDPVTLTTLTLVDGKVASVERKVMR
ncbi:MAG TPA: DUF4124 domain-containing protein [Casimicrobiaceae bacterium]|jgi:hypothetical protein|nr:DUF4124 domain-containing protein [Casimicrobiaceae bacterium]